MVDEPDSGIAAELWGAPQAAFSSILAYPEGRAALAAARRADRLTPAEHRRAVEDFEAVHAEIVVVGIDAPLARHAGEIAAEMGLRGYDAVHLATALALGSDTVLVTWDRELGRAAVDSGCAAAPPP